MPSYAKFMKDILSNKRKLEDNETIMLTEECGAILQHKLQPKLKDPRNFTISSNIGNLYIGASINLMSLFLFKKLGLGEAKVTIVSLQLADRSIKHPRGICEDILVKEGIVLGRLISARGIEVDRTKIQVTEKLPPPVSGKELEVF
ncbi:unnamed protein product [Fraxinus pennsylvanica]|uniref:Uncharacterized protein n=1 Tax=Fraxinus pennsylvanica TaxID=56036 RepID=A0AAD2AG58_9LAMI|nr:unnamed protein product [Fraxinus pennsylvanica]